MKKLILLAIIALSLNSLSAQNYLDKISIESCQCFDGISDTMNVDQYTMEIGLCMIQSAMPYKKELKKEHGINMNNIDQEGEALGQLIALNMANHCPEKLLAMSKRVTEGDPSIMEEQNIQGTITKVEDETVVIVSLKDEVGKSHKFYWLYEVDTNYDMVNKYKSLIDKDVEIEFKIDEIFDPRIQEYRQVNVLLGLDAK